MANAIANHKRGDTWKGMIMTCRDNNLLPVNLTGYTVISSFKDGPSGSLMFEFKTSNNTILIPVGTDGKIHFIKRKMDVPAGRYVFDVELTSPTGDVETIVESYWEITQDIS